MADGGLSPRRERPTMDDVMPTEPSAARAGMPAAPSVLLTDLERFWPSRRGHAFDEFCR